jgi:hypothetical protein
MLPSQEKQCLLEEADGHNPRNTVMTDTFVIIANMVSTGGQTMPRRKLDPNALGMDEDFHGNVAAFTCPVCGKVFLVSSSLDRLGRACPNPACGRSFGLVVGGATSGGVATLEWPD